MKNQKHLQNKESKKICKSESIIQDSSSENVNINKIENSAKLRNKGCHIEYLQKKYKSIINAKNYSDYNNYLNPECGICKDSITYIKDELFLCDLCFSATHQSCYGSELIGENPSNAWYCARCKYYLENPQEEVNKIKCFLCSDITGLIKSVDGEKWAHIVCIQWMPELYFTDLQKEKPNISKLDLYRSTHLICDICKKHEGSCIQCDDINCDFTFHVTCAQKSDIIKRWDIMESKRVKG